MNFLRNLSIKGKLSLLVGTLATGFVIFGLMTFTLLGDLQKSSSEVSLGRDLLADILPPPCYIIEIYLNAYQMELAGSREELDQHIQTINRLKQEFEARTQFWKDTLPEGVIKEELTNKSSQLAHQLFAIMESEYVPALQRSNYNEARQILHQKLTPIYQAHRNVIDNLVVASGATLSMADAQASERIASSTAYILSVAGSILFVGIILAVVIIAQIVRPLKKVIAVTGQMNQEFVDFAAVLEAVSKNDLTQEVRTSKIERLNLVSEDDIGSLVKAIERTMEVKDRLENSLKATTDNLSRIIGQLGQNSREVVSAATQIASSAEQMSRGAQSQSDQVTQVFAAMEEMTATIIESSKSAANAKDSAQAATKTANDGGRIVEETIKGMGQISTVVRKSAYSIGKLSKSAEEIGEIISVIDDIADQTNLLALNAAIEAARAGEQGRGFAVVADEVRKLAERTSKATSEVTNMIKRIQRDTAEAVKGMESGTAHVENGRALTDKAGDSLKEIVGMSQKVMDMIAQMATATEQQSAAAEEISKNMELITNVTQETASGASQSAVAAESLHRQAEALQQIVSSFRLK